jgi:hypothetical protein
MSATSSRRLILLLDGTWNDWEFGPSDTNIVRLRTLISDCNWCRSHPSRRSASPESLEGDGSLSGGALGLGLDRNIRRAYKFLAFHYWPGDEVFIFGFSRGSYTARSLVGYIAAAGLSPKPIYPYRGPLITSGIGELCGGPFRRERAAFRVDIGNEGWHFVVGGDPNVTILDFVNGLNRSGLNPRPDSPLGNEALFGPQLVQKLKERDATLQVKRAGGHAQG